MADFGEEIRQEVFRDGKVKALLNVIYTSNWIRDLNTPIFKEYGILQQHYNVLRIVRGRKGECVTPGEIISVMLDKGRDLTRLVDKLVKKGLLEREQSPKNRRKVHISMTEEGVRITGEIEVKINSWIESQIKLTKEECDVLNSLLDKMRNSH